MSSRLVQLCFVSSIDIVLAACGGTIIPRLFLLLWNACTSQFSGFGSSKRVCPCRYIFNYRNSLTLFFRPWAFRFKGKDRASLVIHGLFYHRHMVCLFALLVTQIHQKPYSRWTRISLGLAIARIIPRWEPVRKFTMGVVCAFGGTYVICLSLSVSHCVKDKTWHRPGIPIVSCGSKPLGIMGTCSTSFPFVSQRLFANLIFACFSGYYI
jgi:hypothetical protein